MSENQPTRHRPVEAPSLDTPEALAVGGFHDDEGYEDEYRAPASAEQVGPLRAVRLLYRHYWNSRGEASASEFWWALSYLLMGTVLIVGLASWLNTLIESDQASSIARTLFMFLVVLIPLWVAANIGPAITLTARRRRAVQNEREKL
ncbi:hypothetical protein ACN08Y_00070 [Rothia sp. P5764]|uniref:hypothetical protein n=1 Tax=Rothia sp. P5764 TaxID=3402654 RepID=UPI003ACA8B21